MAALAMSSLNSSIPRNGEQSRRLRVPSNYRDRRPAQARSSAMVLSVLVAFLSILSFPEQNSLVEAANGYDDYYAANDDANKNYDDYNYYNGGDDDGNAANDDGGDANDDGNAANGDDDQYAAAAAAVDDQYSSNGYDASYTDDDVFHWDANFGFDGVSVMPLSCINYNSGHMIKFQMFDSANSYQCHFAEISTFVVSISHYMRAYFNYQALKYGEDFSLPADAAYLNCIPLMINGAYVNLYAKVGCMERETFTSTKLQLHVFTDQHCSKQYDDGESARMHATKGYEFGSQRISSKVSFKPDFYSCLTCSPDQISETFNKMSSNWYDDDYISEYGNKQSSSANDDQDDSEGDDQAAADDQYFTAYDDAYQANDDGSQNDDYYNRRQLVVATVAASKEVLQSYHDVFWAEYHELQRNLYDNDYYDVGDWNMCQRIYKYGVWCDEECRSLDLFRTDLWSASDIFLLSIMCTFLTAIMLLIVAKRLKAQQKSRMYGEDQSMPGLPPFAMAIIFAVIMAVIIALAKLKFINETLVFAVVTCILLFIYMLKLTLFENRRPVLLAAPRHDMFNNPLDDHLFE